MKNTRLLIAALSLLLLASLGGNVLLGGIALGHAAKPVPEIVSLGPNLKTLIRSLPEPDRQKMHKNFIGHQQAIKEANEAARKSADEVHEALLAEPFDQARLDAALADHHRDFIALRGLLQDVFWQGVEQLSPDGRHKIADSPAFMNGAEK